jgi:hypothetical protein
LGQIVRTAIGFYIVGDSNPDDDVVINGFPFPFLGEGVYLFDGLVPTRKYFTILNKPYRILKVGYFFDNDKHIDLDDIFQSYIVNHEFKSIWESTKKSRLNIQFLNKMQIIGYLCEIYKRQHNTEAITLTILQGSGYYKLFCDDLPKYMQEVLVGHKIHCVSKIRNIRINTAYKQRNGEA